MQSVNTTELRNHLPKYLADVTNGDEIYITSHGRIVARILPPLDECQEAKKELLRIRKTCTMTDVVSPIGVKWDADQ